MALHYGHYSHRYEDPPVYPYLDIYPSSFPAEVESTTRKCLPIKLLTTYPAFDLCTL